MERVMYSHVVDLSQQFIQIRRNRLRSRLHTVLALWTQYACVGTLLLYALLRVAVCPMIPLGRYSGPLAILRPVAFLLLLTSYVSDILLWQEEI